uniref:Uncharacterized protein n=1 Tax=Rhipicephalus appendiculatus TaxID=34631 RepID=A0A131YDG6_RHIAP
MLYSLHMFVLCKACDALFSKACDASENKTVGSWHLSVVFSAVLVSVPTLKGWREYQHTQTYIISLSSEEFINYKCLGTTLSVTPRLGIVSHRLQSSSCTQLGKRQKGMTQILVASPYYIALLVVHCVPSISVLIAN